MTPIALTLLAVLAFVAFLLALTLDIDPLLVLAAALASCLLGLATGMWIA